MIDIYYAIPFMIDEGDDVSEVSFIRFNTRNEREADMLASCVGGRNARDSLIIMSSLGEIFSLE